MSRTRSRLLIIGLILVGAACAGRAGPDGSPRSQVDTITLQEIERRGPFTNLYDLVQILRPRWIRSQGPDTFMGGQGEVQVHVDGNWLGGVNSMRNLAAHGVTSVRWLDPVDAAARYGLDHGHGAIVISTAPVH